METIAEKSLEDKLKVFSEWQKLYRVALIDFLSPKGDVLEIGFGLGHAAEQIQEHHPKSHTIIESDPVAVINAKKWAEKYPGTRIIEGEWKEAIKDLGQFNALFFNGDMLPEEQVKIMNFLFPEESFRQYQEAQKLKGQLEEQISRSKAQFTDGQIEDFYHKTGRHFHRELPLFFNKLKENGNITAAQYEEAVKKYSSAEKDSEELPEMSHSLLSLLEECLKKHMVKGGRFSAFLSGQTSKYEDAHFFDAIITNSAIHYKESFAPIKLSDKTREGLLILVEKVV